MYGEYPTVVECDTCDRADAIYGTEIDCTYEDCDGTMTTVGVSELYSGGD